MSLGGTISPQQHPTPVSQIHIQMAYTHLVGFVHITYDRDQSLSQHRFPSVQKSQLGYFKLLLCTWNHSERLHSLDPIDCSVWVYVLNGPRVSSF